MNVFSWIFGGLGRDRSIKIWWWSASRSGSGVSESGSRSGSRNF